MAMDLDDHGNMPLKVETILMLQIPNTEEGLVVPCRNTFCSHPDLLECFGKNCFHIQTSTSYTLSTRQR